jgi:hypothetical protein
MADANITADTRAWQNVPERVSVLFPAAVALRITHDKVASDTGILAIATVSWQPEADKITVCTPAKLPASIKTAYANSLGANCGVEFTTTPPDIAHAVIIKTAGFGNAVHTGWNAANSALGGPTPLSNAIVSGLVTGGLGYGAGALAENIIPEHYLDRGRLRKPLGVAGLLAGLGVGHLGAKGTAKALNQGYFKSWLTNNRTLTPAEKTGAAPSNTGLFAPTIAVDAFNRAVWSDASTGYNQTGIIAGHTSPQIAAATTGIMRGVAAQTRSPIVSPANVINTLASAGVGLATAHIAGRTIGALGGLTPAAQNKLQDMGLWAGMLHSVIPPLFSAN